MAFLGPLLWAATLLLPAFGASASLGFTNLYSFPAFANGENPEAGLVQGSDGNFYGTTTGGGIYNAGTVFKISPAGVLTTLYSFTGAMDGKNPIGGVIQGSDGDFYGTTRNGGAQSHLIDVGTVFKITAAGSLTILYSFITLDGFHPMAALVQGSDGNFYGTTQGGGADGQGTVFKISGAGALTNLYSFTGGNDGASPQGALLPGNDGNFYGTTSVAGTEAVWEDIMRAAEGEQTSLHSFTTSNAGHTPSGLAQGNDGDLYGTTEFGGSNDCGMVFKISTAGELTDLHAFSGPNDGASPQGGLVQGSDGNF